MRLVVILRELWRLRVVVAVVGVVAVLAGMVTVYHLPSLQRRQTSVGMASASALIDTPSSQVVDLGITSGTDPTTLSARAALLASLMMNSPIKEEIARRAGVPLATFVAVPPASGGPAPSPAPDVADSSVSASDPRANVLRASLVAVPSGQIPIIEVDAQSPTARQAERLANAAMDVLQAHVKSLAGLDRVPNARRLVVTVLGTAQGAMVQRGPGLVRGIVVMFFVLVLGCGLVLGISWLAAEWRREVAVQEGAFDAWAPDAESADAAPEEDEPAAVGGDAPAAARQRRAVPERLAREPAPQPR